MPPSPATITEQHLSHCFELYPAVVQRAYARQINPKTGAEKKRAEAVERDVWRYDELPEEVGGREDGGLTLQQLERLVLWKITHGASRPFLPAMIRKNAPSAVSEATSLAAKTLSTLTASSTVSQALETTMAAMTTVSTLSGVGPATASLVLAVFQPALVPFFEDELWAWCFPEKEGGKLKYDRKEYELLFRKCWEVKERIGEGRFPGMVVLEKASFVLRHGELLEEGESVTLLDGAGAGAVKGEDDGVGGGQETKTTGKTTTQKATKTGAKRAASATEKTSKTEDEASDGRRRSKRARK